MLVAADNHLLLRPADLDYVQRRSRCNAESLALADGEVMNARMLANDLPARGHKFAGCVRQRLSLLREVGINEALIVSARDKANLLRIGLLRQRQSMLAREFAHLWLRHVAEGKQGSAELFLRQSKEKVSLVLTVVRRTLKQPSPSRFVEGDTGVVTSRDPVGADLLRHNQQLIKLQMIIAKAAGDRRPPGKILLYKRTHDVPLKPFFVIHHVVRNADLLRHSAR